MSNLEFVFAIGLAILVVSTAALICVRLFARDAATREALLFTTICLSLATPLILVAVDHLGFSAGQHVRQQITRLQKSAAEPKPFVFEAIGSADNSLATVDTQAQSGGPTVLPNDAAIALDTPTRTARSLYIWKWLMSVWAIGSVVFLLRIASAWQRLRHLVARSIPLADTPAQRAIEHASELVRTAPATSLHVSSGTSVPIAVGMLSSKILLPPTWTRLTDQQLRDVLAHELTHLARRDPLKLMLQKVAAALYWPIVTLHFVNRQLDSAREEVCDNGVLKSRDAISYGETLLRVATITTNHRNMNLVSVGFMRKQSTLEQRISAVLATDNDRRMRPALPKLIPTCGFLALLVAAVCAFAANPQSAAGNQGNAVTSETADGPAQADEVSVEGKSPESDRDGGGARSESIQALVDLSRAYEDANNKYSRALYADDPELKKQAEHLYPDDEFIPKFLELEEKFRGQEAGFQALRFLIVRGGSYGDRDSAGSKARVTACARLEEFYVDHPDADSCLKMYGGVPFRSAESLYKKFAEHSPHSHVRAAAWFYFAEWQLEISRLLAYAKNGLTVDELSDAKPSFREFIEEVLRFEEVGVEVLRTNAISAAERVMERYDDDQESTWTYSGPLRVLQVRKENGPRHPLFGIRANALLRQLRQFSPGAPAPEITGTDADGTTFRLSDYRGRVVVLICGDCNARHSQNRKLLNEFKNLPVEILGIATDQTIDAVWDAYEKGQVTWRVWWDGGKDGPIVRQWNAGSKPASLIIDHKGVIRYSKYCTGTLIRKLLEERALDPDAKTMLDSHPIPEIPTLVAAQKAAKKRDQETDNE